MSNALSAAARAAGTAESVRLDVGRRITWPPLVGQIGKIVPSLGEQWVCARGGAEGRFRFNLPPLTLTRRFWGSWWAWPHSADIELSGMLGFLARDFCPKGEKTMKGSKVSMLGAFILRVAAMAS
jgi:hypothetical protein